jgi:hypothetical protein
VRFIPPDLARDIPELFRTARIVYPGHFGPSALIVPQSNHSGPLDTVRLKWLQATDQSSIVITVTGIKKAQGMPALFGSEN